VDIYIADGLIDDVLEFGDEFEKCDLKTLCDILLAHPNFCCGGFESDDYSYGWGY
jgi:hypothetical protein